MNSTLVAPAPGAFQAHSAPVKMVRFSPSGAFMATGDTELQIKVWRGAEQVVHIDPRSFDEKVKTTENIRGMEFSADEKSLLASASDSLDAFSLVNGSREWSYFPPRLFGFLVVSPQALAVGPSGNVAASFDYGSIAMFTPSGDRLWRVRENYAPRQMAFAHQGQNLVGADSFNLCLWDAATGDLIERKKMDQKMYALAVLPGDGMVVTRELHTLSLYQLSPFRRVFEIPAGRGLPTVAASTRTGLIASGERDRIRLVNLEGQGVRDIHADANVLSLAFTPEGTQLAAGCSDGQVRQWDVDQPAV